MKCINVPWTMEINQINEINENENMTLFHENVIRSNMTLLGKLAKQIFGKSWEFGPTGLTPAPLPKGWDFFREFFRNFRQKRVKYAIKTVIYKSWDWVRPPLLGPNSQLLPKICFACFPYDNHQRSCLRYHFICEASAVLLGHTNKDEYSPCGGDGGVNCWLI